MNILSDNKLVVLLSIDGWGVSLNTENNAIRKAKIDGFKNLVTSYPSTVITMPGLDDSLNYKSLGLAVTDDDQNNSINLSLSKIISQAGLKQLKISNSNDFPLVSVFFNNSDNQFDNEDWMIIDNDRYSFWPFLKSNNLEKKLIKQIELGDYNFIFSVLPNIKQEFFKGDFPATISAVENISESLEKIAQAVLEKDGVLIITSTYGGAEDVFNIGTGIANKKKTDNAVPFLIIGHDYQGRSISLQEAPNNDLSLLSPQGSYLDIGPTILKILNLPVPPEMTGKSFI
jgi:2,3-bisphosphoglycerate-independent phosphoglycerate mutase